MAITTMIRSTGLPWTDLGTQYQSKPTTAQKIITESKLDWTVNAAQMKTDEFGEAAGWYQIYREDTNRPLGVVHTNRLMQVQNTEMFSAIEPLLQDGTVNLDTSARFGNTDLVFGTFELSQEFEILGDKMKHYLVVINDHLKPDGRITVLNTPVRVACSNMLAEALSSNLYKMRIAVSPELTANRSYASKIIMEANNSMRYLKGKAEKMASRKVSDSIIDKTLDIIIPFPELDGVTEASTRKAEEVEMIREVFRTEYLDADDLQNIKNTGWGLYQAVADFSQHAWKKVDSAYNLTSRMKTLPGIGEKTIVQKYLAAERMLFAA